MFILFTSAVFIDWFKIHVIIDEKNYACFAEAAFSRNITHP